MTVFESTLTPVKPASSFMISTLPTGLFLFSTLVLKCSFYMAYASSAATGTGGLVTRFDLNGGFIKVVAPGRTLNQPWGVAIAPASFGQFSYDLLIGTLQTVLSAYSTREPKHSQACSTVRMASYWPM